MVNQLNMNNFCKVLFLSLITYSHTIQNSSWAQQANVFEENKGSLTEFFQPIEAASMEKYKKKYQQLHRKEGFEFKNLMIQGSAFTRGLNKTGIVNLNSKATRYLNDIKSHLLSDYPKADKDIQVLITFNPALNAMATINEKIYVNVGLLARVKNEAQLAFIMAHELMHIINMHSVEQYKALKKEVKDVQQSDISRKANQIELFKHNMSVKHELEADADGFHLYLAAGYSANEAFEALKILESADDELVQKKVSAEILRVSIEAYDKLMENLKSGKIKDVEEVKEDLDIQNLKDKLGVEEDEELSTHPDIKSRLEKISELIKANKNNKSTIEYKIDKALFDEIKVASLIMVNNSYNQSSDFGGAYLIYSNLLLEGKKNDNILNHFCYAVFGIIHDRKFKYKYNLHKHNSHEDSVFVAFYRTSTLNDITLWGLDVLNSVRTERNRATIDKFSAKIVALVKNDKRINPSDFEKIKLFDETNAYEYKGLSFSEIDFTFSFYNSISRKLKRDFNKQKIFENKKEGKIAFLDMNNLAVDIGSTMASVNFERSDKLDFVSQTALIDLASGFKKDLILAIPNSVKYNDEQYKTFQLLSKWLSERIYFDGAPYESLYEEEMQAFRRDTDVRYLMVNLTLEVRNPGQISLKRLGGIVLAPLYLPQAYTNRQHARTRDYILTLILDIEDGSLVMWDKRTTEEPMNSAFIYNIYDDIIKSFIKK